MGKKIFVSYKYRDDQVEYLPNDSGEKTTVRHYIDLFQDKLGERGHVDKGERDNEDMSDLADTTIASKLGDKIFDSTVTVVFVSKGMKDLLLPENEQWIPWEVSYSLREQSRQGQNSKTNAVLAVVLPDQNGSYEYFITYDSVCETRILQTSFLFEILRRNMFNIKKADTRECRGRIIYSGSPCYIHSVKWKDFISDIDKYIEIALEIWRKRDSYDIVKKLK